MSGHNFYTSCDYFWLDLFLDWPEFIKLDKVNFDAAYSSDVCLGDQVPGVSKKQKKKWCSKLTII